MSRFCPYCGNQLSDRSKFCPRCGKASPARRQAAVSVEEQGSAAGVESSTPPARAVWSGAGISARTPGPARNGQAADRLRYAPPTHAMVGFLEQAGFGLRYGAWMFDFLITLIAIMGFTFAVSALSHKSLVGSDKDMVIVAGLTVLLFLLNFVVLAGWNGQTAGMRILGVRIVRLDGTPFTIRHALLRHLVGYPLSTVAFLLGFLWMLWDPRQQGWHDKLASTIVVMT